MHSQRCEPQQIYKAKFSLLRPNHCVKSVRMQSHSGQYSVRMPENADQNNSEYGHFSRSEYFFLLNTLFSRYTTFDV